jgi:hypothetical protein
VREFDGRWLAVADVADQQEIGIGATAEEALNGALERFGPRINGDLVRSATRTLR